MNLDVEGPSSVPSPEWEFPFHSTDEEGTPTLPWQDTIRLNRWSGESLWLLHTVSGKQNDHRGVSPHEVKYSVIKVAVTLG